jgi:hypothetical protein
VLERRVLIGSAGLAILLLTVLLAAARGASTSADTASCKLHGIRYAGSTSQKKKLCFVLSSKAKTLNEYSYDFLDTCGTGTSRSVNRRGITTLLPKGAFAFTTPDTYFKGVVKGGKANGTLREQGQQTVPGKGVVTCDTHVVHWTAHRVR